MMASQLEVEYLNAKSVWNLLGTKEARRKFHTARDRYFAAWKREIGA